MSKDTSSPDTEHELFDLCKKVYELTGWDNITLDYYLRLHKPTKQIVKVSRFSYDADSYRYRNSPETARFREENEVVILYTSDYLLEKLPRYEIVDNGVMATASFYDSDKDAWYYGDDRTALKALLKLVIALEKAGVEL
jgi:hypothetical protein